MNNFLSTNPTTLILSSLVSEFYKKSKSEKKKKCGLKRGGVGGVGGGTETKTVHQTVKRGKIQNINYIHNVKHVVQSIFQNTKITFKVNPTTLILSSLVGEF